VQFALDVESSGKLIFPATEFTYGVTRVYVQFVYQGLGEVEQVESLWYRNENPISSGRLAWDGGEEGTYLVWIEDPNGLGRGNWRWELGIDGAILGGGTFFVGGAPGYSNETWGFSFDPPVGWELKSEQPEEVIFSSLDQRRALAVRVAADAQMFSDAAAANRIFELDQAEAEIVVTETVTMNGEEALLQQVRLVADESEPELLFVVSALHAESAYSLWILGPAEDEQALKSLLATTLYSIRFSSRE
jgi:hypothetical protein